MLWFRIDNRLIHGQVIEAWLPYTKATYLYVVSDILADDHMQQTIMSLAIPSRVKCFFLSIDSFISHFGKIKQENDALVLFSNCSDFQRVFEADVGIEKLNIGNIHYANGKTMICQHVALSSEEELCLRTLKNKGVELDFRCIPNEIIFPEGW